jgi:transcriptional regulator
MALYVPPVFAAGDRSLALALIDEHPFATLVTPHGGEPQVTHLPLTRDGDDLLGHVARANPHWRRFADGESLAVFAGPHAYVSPTWYAAPKAAVPTWNFAVVHVHGRIALLDDARERERVVERLVARFEGEGEEAWRFALTGRERDAMLGAIVAFRMPIERLEAKLKLSQNRGADDRARVAAALARSDDPQAQATAAWMRRAGAVDDDG